MGADVRPRVCAPLLETCTHIFSSKGKQRRLKPSADAAAAGAVPVQMWQRWAQSRRRCGSGGCSPSADVAAAGAVPAQMGHARTGIAGLGCAGRQTGPLPLNGGRGGLHHLVPAALGRVRPCRQGRAASLGRRTGQRRNGQPIAARRTRDRPHLADRTGFPRGARSSRPEVQVYVL
jgi:hypothetical protein